MERTLGIIKPDAVAKSVSGQIIARIESEGLKILGLRMVRLTRHQAEQFYAVHKDKPFYAELVQFMTSGPVITMALEADDAVLRWRTIMGATNPAAAAEGTLRRTFAESVQRNAVHGSDSQENAAIEIAFFFPAMVL